MSLLNIKKLAAALAVACSLAFATSASAVLISYSNYGVGEWTPANEFNSDEGVLKGVNRSVDIWNGIESPGLFTDGVDSATFTKGAGLLVPINLTNPLAYVDRVEDNDLDSWSGLDNTLGLYTYITAKYGNGTQRVLYVGNILDVITVEDNLGSSLGLSHVSWFSGNRTTVPDSGATVALIALGIAGLGLVARRGKV